MSEGLLMTFGQPVNPCEDCIDGWCTMNCSPKAKKEDHGSLFITREDDGSVTVRVRPIGRYESCAVNVPPDVWQKMMAEGLKNGSPS